MARFAKRILIVAISIMYWAMKCAARSARHLSGPARRAGCVVLYYHGVTGAQQLRFRRQMRYLRRRAKVVRPTDILSSAKTNWCVCITFDDGLDSVRRNAVPVLVELRMTAAICVVTRYLGRRVQWEIEPGCPDANEPLMTSHQLLALPTDTIEIGSHTASHADLAALPASEVRRELLESRRCLEALLGKPVETISLPFGRYTFATVELAQGAGYKIILTCEPQVVYGSHDGPAMGRFEVTPDDWMVEFRLKIDGAYNWLRYVRHLRRCCATVVNHRWLGAALLRSFSMGKAVAATRRSNRAHRHLTVGKVNR